MYKSRLQELCQQCSWELPEYVTVKDGPDHCPRFTTTCTVRGVPFESPKNACKSSKEAQNMAAKIAYDHLYALRSTAIPPSSPSPSSLPPPGFLVSSSINSNVKPSEGEELLQNNSQTSLPNAAPSTRGIEMPKSTLHLYKNRLQHYVQKKNLSSLPVYSYEHDGPTHAPRFRATVTVEGRAYQTGEYFTSLREAEYAAAKLAFESLSEDAVQEDESLYKSLLQEFAQKQGFRLPSYSTERTGASHRPAFKSTVEIGGQAFCGAECRTKKLAERNAAKVAFNGLTEARITDTSADGSTEGNSEMGSRGLQPIIEMGLQSTIGAGNALEAQLQVVSGQTGEIVNNGYPTSPANCKHEAVTSSVCGDSVLTLNSQVDMQPKSRVGSDENNEDFRGREPSAKKHKLSPSTDDKHVLPQTFPLTIAVPDCSSSDAEKVGEGCDTPGHKILVCSRGSNVTIPDGACILPCSNEKWLVMSMDVNQDC